MKVDLKGSWTNLMKLSEAHKPELLTGFGVALMIAAVPLAVVATIKAQEKIKEKKEEVAQDILENSEDQDTPVDVDSVELTVKDVLKVTWPYYIPVVLATAVGGYCTVSATKEGLRRTAAAMAMYQLSESAFSNYRSATKEVVGEKKEDEIHSKLMKDRMELMTDENGCISTIYDTRDGTTLCFDYWCGRYFYSDIDYIRSQINRINEDTLDTSRKTTNAFSTLNDVYNAIGLPDAARGEEFVWRIGKEGLIELRPTSKLVDDKPCWVLNFRTPPAWVPAYQLDQL